MKDTFIIDENVFIQSHTCKNIKNSADDFSALGLVFEILSRCHKIGLTPELTQKYQEKSKILEENKKLNPACIRMWSQLWMRNDKQRYCTSCLNNLSSNILHDRHVIEPAVFLSGVLVTTDEKLIERVTAWAKTVNRELRIMSPQQAISHLQLWQST